MAAAAADSDLIPPPGTLDVSGNLTPQMGDQPEIGMDIEGK